MSRHCLLQPSISCTNGSYYTDIHFFEPGTLEARRHVLHCGPLDIGFEQISPSPHSTKRTMDKSEKATKLSTPTRPEKKEHDAAMRFLKLFSWKLFGHIATLVGLEALRVEWEVAVGIQMKRHAKQPFTVYCNRKMLVVSQDKEQKPTLFEPSGLWKRDITDPIKSITLKSLGRKEVIVGWQCYAATMNGHGGCQEGLGSWNGRGGLVARAA